MDDRGKYIYVSEEVCPVLSQHTRTSLDAWLCHHPAFVLFVRLAEQIGRIAVVDFNCVVLRTDMLFEHTGECVWLTVQLPLIHRKCKQWLNSSNAADVLRLPTLPTTVAH